MKLILHYIKKHLGIFMASIFFLTVEAGADLLQPAFMAHIVDDGVKGGDVGRILGYGGVMVAIAATGAIGAVMRNLFAGCASQTIAKELRGDLYRKAMALSLEDIERFQPASIITRITNDVNQVQEFINGSMRIMAKAPITCIGAILLIVFQTPRQLPVIGVILVIVPLFIGANMKIGYPRFGILQKSIDGLNNVSREFLSSVRVVKAFCGEAQEAEKFEEASGRLSAAGVSAMQVMAVFSPLINLAVNLGIVALLWVSRRQDSGEIGRLMASVNYMTQVLFALSMVSGILNTAVRAMASSARIQEILERRPEQGQGDRGSCQNVPLGTGLGRELTLAAQRGQELKAYVGKTMPEPRGRRGGRRQEPPPENGLNQKQPEFLGALAFEDVSFAYEGAKREALRHISFQAEPGEMVGIIGPTSSGKTTLSSLIPRFYDAAGGSILLDGRDAAGMDMKALRRAVAVAPQEALLFTGTILENLRWGKEDADMEEVERAASLACAQDFVLAAEKGYDTLLGQGGVNLSGGQKQRLSLARALLRTPQILILDDCTSALDAETEAAVLDGLRRQAGDMTILLISQRISTVMRADRILCLDEGRVQGWGSHKELLAGCRVYQAIYESQIGRGGESRLRQGEAGADAPKPISGESRLRQGEAGSDAPEAEDGYKAKAEGGCAVESPGGIRRPQDGGDTYGG